MASAFRLAISRLLRPRFRPGWVSSWVGTKNHRRDCEDGQVFIGVVMDATRLADETVSLKITWRQTHPNEVAIAQNLSSPELASNPKNHCVPTFEVLDVPDYENLQILVMPLLRVYNQPTMRTVGEAVGFFQQIFEVLCLPKLRVLMLILRAYNSFINTMWLIDCADRNVMMYSPEMFPKGYHPQKPSRTTDLRRLTTYRLRTECPPKYYFIDFGISRRFTDDNASRLLPPVFGVDKSVPEFRGKGHRQKWDPFPIDVYYIGNLVLQDFVLPYRNFEFMTDFVNDMVNSDPSKRPTIDEVLSRFESISQSLGRWKLQSRLSRRSEFVLFRPGREFVHLFKRLQHLLKGYPAIPSPNLSCPSHVPFAGQAVSTG